MDEIDSPNRYIRLNHNIGKKLIKNLTINFYDIVQEILNKKFIITSLLVKENIYKNNDTKLNHLIPCSYFSKWKDEKKPPREKIITLKKANNIKTIKLQKFKSINFLISQKLEKIFTKFQLKDNIFSSESIKVLDLVQESIDKNFLLDCGMHIKPEGVKNGILFKLTPDKKELNKSDKEWNLHKKGKTKSLSHKENFKIKEIKLFMISFKAREQISKLGSKSYEVTLSILNILVAYIDNNDKESIKDYELLYREIAHMIIFYYSVSELNISKEDGNIYISWNEKTNSQIDNSKINIFKQRASIKKLILFIIKEININKKENTTFISHVNSVYYHCLCSQLEKLNNLLNYFVYYSKIPLKTSESPFCYAIVDENYVKILLSRNDHLLKSFSGFEGAMKINMLAYSPNILIVESIPAFIDFLHIEFLNSFKEKNTEIEEFDTFLISLYDDFFEGKVEQFNHWIIEKQ